jgi:cell division septal protein FtsQ
VIGSVRASSEAIRGALKPYLGRNLLDINLNEVAAIAGNDPWVAGTSVSRVLPATLQIRLEERQPAALAVIGGVAHLVDRTGYVIGDTGFERSDDLPVLTGLAGLDDAELAGAIRRGVQALERLRLEAPAFTAGISELDLSRGARLTVRTVLPGPRLLLDPIRVARNVTPYLRLSEEIRGRFTGSDYVDLRWRDRITVGPTPRERS